MPDATDTAVTAAAPSETAIDSQMANAQTSEQERRAIFAACERSLSGHGRTTLRGSLETLLREAGEDEDPDMYGRGALIEDFEREIAQLLGKAAAVFMPSGTMAQQIALRIWSERRNCATVAFHPLCH